MTQLIPIQLDDDIEIYIEAVEDVEAPPISTEKFVEEEKEEALTDKAISSEALKKKMDQNFHSIQGTIRAYTIYTLNAFRKVAIAEVDKVTLEFGIELAGEAGVPYVTKGTAKSNLKVTVQCSFPKNTEQK